jgi:hypothetical protein
MCRRATRRDKNRLAEKEQQPRTSREHVRDHQRARWTVSYGGFDGRRTEPDDV